MVTNFNDDKFKNENIVGKRFGRFTVTKLLHNYTFECVSDAGEIVTIAKGDLLSLSFLAWYDRKYCVLKYGAVTDYDYEGLVKCCSYCGAPDVYGRTLCRNCYSRSLTTGKVEYTAIPEPVKPEKAKIRREASAKTFSLARKHPDAKKMADLYYTDGLTYQQIADRYGISRQRVHAILHTKYKRG